MIKYHFTGLALATYLDTEVLYKCKREKALRISSELSTYKQTISDKEANVLIMPQVHKDILDNNELNIPPFNVCLNLSAFLSRVDIEIHRKFVIILSYLILKCKR